MIRTGVLLLLLATPVLAGPPKTKAPAKSPTKPATKATTPTKPPAPPPTPATLYAQAQQAARKGDIAKAIRLCKGVLMLDPQEAAVWGTLGRLQADLGKFTEAQTSLATAVKLAPTTVPFQVDLAECRWRAGNSEAAYTSLQKTIAAFPEESSPHFALGRLLYADSKRSVPQRFVEAEMEFQSAVTLAPTVGLYRANLGLAQLFQGKEHWEEARTSLTTALLYDNPSETARLGIAYLEEQENHPDRAIAYYRDIVTLRPNNHYARRRLAGLLIVSGQREAGYAEMRELAKRNPKDTFYLKELASFYLGEKRTDDAGMTYALAVERNPKDVDALVGLGQCCEAKQKFTDAVRAYQAAMDAAPQDPRAYLLLAERHMQTDQSKKAIAVMERFVAAAPSNPIGHWQLALLYKGAKRYDEALAQMRAITYSPGDPNARLFRLGVPDILMAQNKFAEAVTASETVVNSDPGFTQARLQLATAYGKAGRWDDAAKAYEAVLAVEPANALAKSGLDEAKSKQGNPTGGAK